MHSGLEKKHMGRVYTPEYIIDSILDLSGYVEERISKKHVIDNSCGDGAFLCKIVNRYCSFAVAHGTDANTLKQELEKYIHGIEIDSNEQIKCIQNLSQIVESFGITDVKWDIMCADATSVIKYNKKMDFVLGNPPYIRVHNLGESYDTIKRYAFSQGGMTDFYIVFYEIGINMLNDTGVLGYITPSSYFNSVAGNYMRSYFVNNNLLDKIVDLKHYQAFEATTYTAITILRKGKQNNTVDYYQFDNRNLIPYYCETLESNDYYISSNYYFSSRKSLSLLKRIFFNVGHTSIQVKNGYATLCDDVFIGDFNFLSKHIIPVVKASTGASKYMIYPYDRKGKLIAEGELQEDKELYKYLLDKRNLLEKRSAERKNKEDWYAFGRSQAINDTYKDKISINTLLRNGGDWKIIDCSAGTGVYSGLYIMSEKIPYELIKATLYEDEFFEYISLLGKYKSGGYYTFSSKEVKAYLDYKFSYEGGLFYE